MPAPTAPPLPAPTPAPPLPPDYSRPGGIYLDILTAYRSDADWYRSLLDTIFMLPADYYPGDLVDTSAAGLNGGYQVRSLVVADLWAMTDAARGNGTPIAVVSGFRSHAQQQSTFDYWVGVGGYQQALRTSARAGHSEHQLGTTLDVTSAGGVAPWEYADWATTPAGAWMAANAWRYGFVMSYPRGSFADTGYDYEPWHYRYVGRVMAAAVRASGIPLRAYLWQTH
jgi:D-alanyl-D-alanine carboxypeptidase